MNQRMIRPTVLAFVVLGLVSCGGGTQPQPGTSSATNSSTQQINGAGATFPYPIYSKWFSEYNKLHPNVRINYQSIGSGGGIRQITNQTVAFGATDGPMTDMQLREAPGPILHLPTVLGAVVPVYNIPGVSTELKFSGPVLADIYLGKIKKWNDPALVKLNTGVALPGSEITVVHRSDGSGTTYIFVDYLSKVSPEFKSTVGVNTSVSWPAGVGGKGNEGVSGLVLQTPGSIGYVELIYALQSKIAFGSVQKPGRRVREGVGGLGHQGRGGNGGDHACRFPGVDHQRGRCRCLPDLVVHMAAALRTTR
jgi:phosphate transport system substrate-binding protein